MAASSADKPTPQCFHIWPHPLVPLASRDFRRLVQASFASFFALNMQTTVLGWMILEMSNSPFYLGLNGFFHMLPALIVTHLGGIVSDRFSSKVVLLIGQACLVVIAIALVLLVLLNSSSVWPLMIVSLLAGAFNTFMHPARAALVGELVDKRYMASGVSLHTVAMSLSMLTAPAFAGWLIGGLSLIGSFIVQVAVSVSSFSSVLLMKATRRFPVAVAAREPAISSLIDGWRYCYRSRLIFTALLATSAYTIFTLPSYVILLPDYARGVLGQGASGLGLLLSAVGAGGLLGSISITLIRQQPNRGLILLGAVALAGVLLNLLALTQDMALAMLSMGVLGASFSVVMIITQSIILEHVSDDMRGRAMGTYMFTGGLMPFGSLSLGSIAGGVGTPLAMTVGGIASIVLAVSIFILRPEIRRI